VGGPAKTGFTALKPALHVLDNNAAGFEWVELQRQPHQHNSLLRKSENPNDTVLIVCNFTPITRVGYRIGVPTGGYWRELLNSDAHEYNGTGVGNMGCVHAEEVPEHGPSVFAKTDFAASGGAIPESRIVAPPSRRLSSQAFQILRSLRKCVVPRPCPSGFWRDRACPERSRRGGDFDVS